MTAQKTYSFKNMEEFADFFQQHSDDCNRICERVLAEGLTRKSSRYKVAWAEKVAFQNVANMIRNSQIG